MSCGVKHSRQNEVVVTKRSYDYSHSALKKFCQLCGKGFSKKKGRVLDEQVYYSLTGLRIFACTRCIKEKLK
jgi:hypothetical protein